MARDYCSNGACRLTAFWWLKLLAGLCLVGAGIFTFVFPLQSYGILTLVLGIVIIWSGIVQLIVAGTNSGFYYSRAWGIASGVVEILIGLIFALWPSMTAVIIPLLLAFWLLYSGLLSLAFSSHMNRLNLSGRGWSVFFGIILIAFSLFLFFQPLSTGVETVIVFMGVSLCVSGINLIFQSLSFRRHSLPNR